MISSVPPMEDCPVCGVGLMLFDGGPHGLAWHQCRPYRPGPDGARGDLAHLAADPEASFDDLVRGMVRLGLMDAISNPASLGQLGAFLTGVGKLKEAGGENNDLGDLLALFAGGEEAE